MLWLDAIEHSKAGNYAAAAAKCQQLIEANPPHVGACVMLSTIAQRTGAYPHAIALAAKAVELAPSEIAPLEQLVNAMLAGKSPFAEIDNLLRSVEPNHAHTARFHAIAAKVLAHAGDADASQRALQRAALAPDADPKHKLTYAEQLLFVGQQAEALVLLKTLDEPEVQLTDEERVMLAETYAQVGDWSAAERHYKALNQSLTDPLNLLPLREIYFKTGQIDEWLKLSETLASAAPRRVGASIAAEQYQFQGRLSEADAAIIDGYYAQGDAATQPVFGHTRLFFDAPTEALKHYIATVPRSTKKAPAESISNPAAANDQQRGQRTLRVGYLSQDFRDHVMGRMMLSIFENAGAAHRVICYATNSSQDGITARIRSVADTYVQCFGMSDSQLIRRMKADRLDILVDMAGPTQGTRPYVLAAKPAPILITHLAAAAPIGLLEVDYKLTDSVCDLPENQEYLVETLLPMAGCCYPVPKYPPPTTGLTKAELGLDKKVTLGAFFNFMKLSERCVRLWKGVLDAIANSVIVFSPLDKAGKVACENIMRQAGIPADRFRFLGSGPTVAEQLARYRAIDFVIDSMPYGGVNGTLEALYMGVPVVTLCGTHHSERTSTSMLTHLGVTDTIAQSPSEYVQIARKLASDSAYRQDVSTRIRARWPKFADPADYARRWEAVLRKVAA